MQDTTVFHFIHLFVQQVLLNQTHLHHQPSYNYLIFISVTQTISIPLKYVCLFTLVIQTSTIVLALRYSRKTSSTSGQIYLSSTAVVVSEVMKILACIFFLLREANNDLDHLKKNMKEQIFQNWTDNIKLTVPAILYTIQNNLLFLALSYLDAATYQVMHFSYDLYT